MMKPVAPMSHYRIARKESSTTFNIPSTTFDQGKRFGRGLEQNGHGTQPSLKFEQGTRIGLKNRPLCGHNIDDTHGSKPRSFSS
jgi:hypothetical protein